MAATSPLRSAESFQRLPCVVAQTRGELLNAQARKLSSEPERMAFQIRHCNDVVLGLKDVLSELRKGKLDPFIINADAATAECISSFRTIYPSVLQLQHISTEYQVLIQEAEFIDETARAALSASCEEVKNGINALVQDLTPLKDRIITQYQMNAKNALNVLEEKESCYLQARTGESLQMLREQYGHSTFVWVDYANVSYEFYHYRQDPATELAEQMGQRLKQIDQTQWGRGVAKKILELDIGIANDGIDYLLEDESWVLGIEADMNDLNRQLGLDLARESIFDAKELYKDPVRLRSGLLQAAENVVDKVLSESFMDRREMFEQIYQAIGSPSVGEDPMGWMESNRGYYLEQISNRIADKILSMSIVERDLILEWVVRLVQKSHVGEDPVGWAEEADVSTFNGISGSGPEEEGYIREDHLKWMESNRGRYLDEIRQAILSLLSVQQKLEYAGLDLSSV